MHMPWSSHTRPGLAFSPVRPDSHRALVRRVWGRKRRRRKARRWRPSRGQHPAMPDLSSPSPPRTPEHHDVMAKVVPPRESMLRRGPSESAFFSRGPSCLTWPALSWAAHRSPSDTKVQVCALRKYYGLPCGVLVYILWSSF